MQLRQSLDTLVLICIWAVIGLFFVSLPALASGRVALLIGNSDYATADMALRNPVNDVTALGEALRELGFDVSQATDQDADNMQQALTRFGVAAKGAEMAVFFYAGHGVQIGGENHLIGTDFQGSDLQALRRSSITIDQVRDVIAKAGPDVGILLLDACRNNPFSDSGLVERGLVRVRGGAGLLIAYATDPGNVAYDGIGQNSVFTTSLLDHIATPDLDVRLMLGRVRQQVVLDTDGRQIPWVEESVLDEHSFAPGLSASGDAQDQTAADLALWRDISSSDSVADFESYLRSYPDGLFAAFAQDRIEGLATRSSGPLAPVSATLSQADPEQVAAALLALGHLRDAQTRDLGPALNSYRRRLSAQETASAERLYEEASQASVFLAATTLRRLRTDIVALRSVERTLAIAEDALAQIEDIARTNTDALPVLQQARNDIYDIYRSRGVILRRLDQSRSYYDELLNRAAVFVPPGFDTSFARGAADPENPGYATAQLSDDAALFLRHVAQVEESKKGSYQWLADLIPPD